jgi:hypothetical protein
VDHLQAEVSRDKDFARRRQPQDGAIVSNPMYYPGVLGSAPADFGD